jgi:IS30 family transposase
MKHGTTYQQLSYEERVSIETLRKRGVSIRAISRTLGRSANTIAQEVREKTVRGVYTPRKAHHKTYVRRWRSKVNCMKVAMSPELTKLVREKLLLKWSPERIAGYAARMGMSVSQRAVYRYVHSRALDQYLFWSRIKKKRGLRRGHHGPQDRAKRLIGMRPPTRSSGHWELDFIVSRQSSVVLMVLVDRWTRYTLIRVLRHKTHVAVLHTLKSIKQKYKMKTVTTDNDIVFRGWTEMEYGLSTLFYFALPYHSWEKGLVENTNRWIRTFVPKKTDLALLTRQTLTDIDTYLNKTPRQCLGYRTAEEVLLTNRVS